MHDKRKANSTRWIAGVAAIAIVAIAAGCASSGGSDAADPANANRGTPPPADSPLAQIVAGQTSIEVQTALGAPDKTNQYMTGKSWIPFYFGPDTSRSDWFYAGVGRVVFSRNQYSGDLRVIEVIYNPDEMK